MIVEDNHRARRALSSFIRLQTGLQVAAEASNGAEAIDLIKHRVPDVILMDARMPVMDGIEAIRIIKKSWPQVKIIVLSMYSQYELEASAAGADAFLRKGCDTGQIVSTLQAFFN
jgi:YesN/AraC family two-component response regulator